MPLYDYECSVCGEVKNVWAKIHEETLPCPECRLPMKRLISASNIQCDLQPYYDENLCASGSTEGSWVESRQHRKQLMKQFGLMEIG